ncbi:MAG: ACT domain-containing protein [Lachnospiraceae bacterium]|nr:ACT domain-containing protein [Lachnospiraceae bacterium]
MSIKQISVFLENKPGTLSRMTKVLADHKIDLRALSLAETKDFGIARMIVDDVLAATSVLKDADFIASLTPVLAYEIPDETGGLNKLLQAFNECNVNVEYMYSFLGGKKAKSAYMIFRVADTEAAEAALTGKGLRPLTQEQVGEI